jgi:putative ATP-dependent endonuclease of the OLD family
MPIILKSIRVAGFRALKNIEISLCQKTVLIGTNNVGKTTLLNALQLAFGDSRWVTQDDFSIGPSENDTKIKVDVQFIPVDSSGKQVSEFESKWSSIFRREIREGDSGQFFGFRTTIQADEKQMRLVPTRMALNEWVAWDGTDAWTDETIEGSSIPISTISDHIPFFFQNAQRDILEDIRQRTSFLGRVLSKVHYSESDREGLQELIQEVNEQAVQSSQVLKNLKENLAELGNTFGTTRGSADITPFAKDIRDLSKGIRLHFGDGIESFSMEYHGMGTRSWASLLTLKSFVSILAGETTEAYSPILALEEPEAHLHPNAQKQIMDQILNIQGQVIVSTHSPYVAAQADLSSIRCLYKTKEKVIIGLAPGKWDEDTVKNTNFIRRIDREILQTRGDILFARAWLLFEGETEAQALPLFFKHFFNNREACDLGISMIGVSGSGNYSPFIRLAQSFNIPWYIFSDGETDVVEALTKTLQDYTGMTGRIEDHPRVVILPEDLDYEGLLLHDGYLPQCIAGIESVEKPGFIRERMIIENGTRGGVKKTDAICDKCNQHIFKGPIKDYSGEENIESFITDLLDKSQAKTKYACPIAEQILKLPDQRNIPSKVRELFNRMHTNLFPGGVS